MIVELAVGRLAGGPDAVEAQLSRSGLAGVDEAANVAAEGSETQPVAGANHLQEVATKRMGLALSRREQPPEPEQNTSDNCDLRAGE